MVEVIFSGMLSNGIMLVLYNGDYYKVRGMDTHHVIGLTYKIHWTKLIAENIVRKET